MAAQHSRAVLENTLAVFLQVYIQPYHPEIPLLGFYPSGMKIHVNTKTCLRMFVATLCVIIHNWKQLKLQEEPRISVTVK